MRASRRWLLVLPLAAALAALVVLSWPRGVSAHAVLERSLPVENDQIPLAQAPTQVETWYSEALERSLTSLKVFDTDAKAIQVGDTRFSDTDPTYAAISLPPNLQPGIYTVVFQNVSKVDGHTWTGSFPFIILNADGSVPNVSAPNIKVGAGQGYLPGAGDSTLRWLEMLAAVSLAGALGFYLLIARPAAAFLREKEIAEVERIALPLTADLVVVAAPVLALAAFGQVLLLADRLGGPGRMGDILFNTRTGELWLSRMGISAALLLLFLPALLSPSYRTGGRGTLLVVVGLAGSLGLLMTYSLASHSATGGGEFWGVGSDFVHFVATAAWLGALLQLPLLFWWTRGRLDGANRPLYLANAFDRFSWLAVISVVVLIGTGAFNGFVQLPRLPALWDTTYGRVLIVKLSLIIPLLAVAGINSVFLKPALVRAIDALHDEHAEPSEQQERPRLEERVQRLQWLLPRTVAVEFLIGAAVLASVALLTQSTTAKGELRQEAGKPSGQFEASEQVAGLNVDLLIKPFGLGVSTYTVSVTPQAGNPVPDVLDIKLRAFYDDPNAPLTAGISGTDQELKATSQSNVWSAQSALLSRPGDWRIQVRVARRGADDVTTQISVLGVGGILALKNQPKGLFDLPFTFVDWNIVAGGAMMALGVGAFLIWRNRPTAWARSTSASVALASIAALFAGTTLLFGVHAHPGKVNIPPATEKSLANGQALFATNCLPCHGREGKGDGPVAATLPIKPPDFGLHIPYHNDTTLFIWISEGLPLDSSQKVMPAWKNTLSTQERSDIVTYLRHAFGSGVFTPVLPPAETPQPTP